MMIKRQVMGLNRGMTCLEKLLCRGSLLFCIAFLAGASAFYRRLTLKDLALTILPAFTAGMLMIRMLCNSPGPGPKHSRSRGPGSEHSRSRESGSEHSRSRDTGEKNSLPASSVRPHPKARRTAVYYTVWLLMPVFTVTGYMRAGEDESISPLKEALVRSTDSRVTGVINYISIREDGYQLILTGSSAQIGQFSYDSEGVIVNCDYRCITVPKIGEIITAEGKLYPCEKPVNPGQFDSDRYYRNRGIDARMYADSVKTIPSDDEADGLITTAVYRIGQIMFDIRCFLSEGIIRVLPAQEAGVLISMLTGDRGMLDAELKSLYSEGGIAHILSISALHVSLLGLGLYKLLMKLTGRLRLSSVLTIIALILYGVLTGFSVSTVRAVIMLSLRLVARMIGRPYDMLSGVAFTALIQLMICPGYVFDSGFQMSYTAVLGICAVSPFLRFLNVEQGSKGVGKEAAAVSGRTAGLAAVREQSVKRIRDAMLLSTSVQLFMLPVLMNTYFYVNPYSVLINPVVIPFMAIVLAAGLSSAVFGGLASGIGSEVFKGLASGIGSEVFEGLTSGSADLGSALASVTEVPVLENILLIPGKVLAGPVYYILKLYELICEFEKKLPYSNLITGAPGKVSVIVYYGAFLSAVLLADVIRQDIKTARLNNRNELEHKYVISRRRKISGIAVTLMVAGIAVFLRLPDADLKICIIDVGQGDSTYIAGRHGNMLIDGGSTSVTNVGTYRIIPFLKHEGVRRLDSVYVSHQDRDHISGIIEMFEAGYPEIGELVVGVNTDPSSELLLAAAEKNIPVRTVSSGDSEESEAFRIEVIAPASDFSYSDANSGSMVLELFYGNLSMLLTGDTDFEAEEYYTRQLHSCGYTILKCAHHGSKYSTSLETLFAVRPILTTISCSKYNTYGHPAKDTLERLNIAGSEVLITSECGMIIAEYDEGEDSISVRKTIHDSGK